MPKPTRRRTTVGSSPATDEASQVRPKWLSTVPEILTPEEARAKREWIAALYTKEIVSKAAKAAQLAKPADIKALKEHFVLTGLWFIDQKDLRHPNASYAVEREQLRNIASQAKKLRQSLATLNDEAARSLWHVFGYSLAMLHPKFPSGHVTDFGLTVTKRQHTDGAFEIQHLRPHQIAEAIFVLEKLAEQTSPTLPTKKGGQHQDEVLLNWINSARHFWLRHSQMAFDPRNHAYDFCYVGFQPLDGNISEQKIKTAMRAVNKRHSMRNL